MQSAQEGALMQAESVLTSVLTQERNLKLGQVYQKH